ncbi:cation-translocating P-type ATPase [Sphingomonas flavalba]|uniref:cation-translocating P-type ATPase n=1 Tax=Sphingomonas flavalba TaxID=2559804 RepID=UPI0039DF5350
MSHGGDELLLASRALPDGLRQNELAVPGIHCGGCIRRIEQALTALPGIAQARVNLSTRRVTVRWRAADGPPPVRETLEGMGYEAHLQHGADDRPDATLSTLIRALAVAGFAAMNIMGLSVSVWSGATGETRDLFHWISAAIALPALAYSGRIFFASAWRALRRGQTNMDVPISIGVLLAFGMSLYDTLHHQPHAYFDASISLLFFLLIGRTLDHVMRERARTAVKGLSRLAAYGAMVVEEDGSQRYTPTEDIAPGMTILLAAGERVPVDATVLSGRSDLDCALLTGESAPQAVAAGSVLRAGTLNLTGPLTIRADAIADDSFLAEMVRLMEAAESGRSGYRRLADRAARLYAPVVHSAALLSFIGWMLATGDAHRAVTVAVAVLIITCPCALGLAVPMVHVIAARRLYERGIMMKDGSALERLGEVDTVLFDKTGTLTLGKPTLRRDGVSADHLAIAAALGAHSRHPYSRALAAFAGSPSPDFHSVVEKPGLGLEATVDGGAWRLGRAGWAIDGEGEGHDAGDAAETLLTLNGRFVAAFRFDDDSRPGAADAVAALRGAGLSLAVLSGDRAVPVARLADALGIATVHAEMLPGEKTAHIRALAGRGHKALMVGDGLNDAPALAAAHVSMTPATAADVGRQAADFVFLRPDMDAVPFAFAISVAARRLVRENFALAVIYNLIALPVAIAGFVTPLIAALAMSGSSIIVVANALRLRPARGAGRRRVGTAAPPRIAAAAQ